MKSETKFRKKQIGDIFQSFNHFNIGIFIHFAQKIWVWRSTMMSVARIEMERSSRVAKSKMKLNEIIRLFWDKSPHLLYNYNEIQS